MFVYDAHGVHKQTVPLARLCHRSAAVVKNVLNKYILHDRKGWRVPTMISAAISTNLGFLQLPDTN